MSHFAAHCSPYGIPPHLDQHLYLLVYTFLLSSDHLDLMSPSCSKHKCTRQYKCLQLHLVYKYMQKRVQTLLEWPHFSLLLCFSIVLSGSPGQIPVLLREDHRGRSAKICKWLAVPTLEEGSHYKANGHWQDCNKGKGNTSTSVNAVDMITHTTWNKLNVYSKGDQQTPAEIL